MTLDSFREMLRRLVKEAGSQRALAKKYGISPMFLCDVLKERRDPGEKFLAAMGFKREVVVRRDVKITKEN